MLGVAIADHYGAGPVNDLTDVLALTKHHRKTLPSIRVYHDGRPHRTPKDEIVVNPDPGERAVFLVRDPRDVIVSLYFQVTKREGIYTGDIGSFLWSDPGGFESIIIYFNAWIAARPVVHLVRYEDLHTDPHGELKRVLEFIGIDLPESSIRRGVEEGRFSNMRKLETSGQVKNSRLQAGAADDPESFKTRRGEVGGYVDYLTPTQIAQLDAYMAKHLDLAFGY